MRIFGKQTAFEGNSPATLSQRDRIRLFRQRHRLGEQCSGYVVSQQRAGFIWVCIDGLTVLARLEARVKEGQWLFFQVVALEPDIVLQERHQAMGQADPLLIALHTFWKNRLQLETILGDWSGITTQGIDEKKHSLHDMYLAALEAHSQAQPFAAMLDSALKEINTQLALRSMSSLEYCPWRVPMVQRSEVLYRRTKGQRDLQETVLCFNLMGIGQCEVRIVQAQDRASCRIFVEEEKSARAVKRISKLFIAQDTEITYQGVFSLPTASRAGISATLVSAHTFVQGRFLSQV